MESETVYIRKLEGTEVWIPVRAKRIDDSRYELLDNEEFHNIDDTDVLENFAGDIVTLQEHVFTNGEIGKVVKEVIYRANQ
jgi:hypothetical protein